MTSEHITWKTNAWKNPDMVAAYANAMDSVTGSVRMKNRVETAVFPKYAIGKDVLDVGIGTGRASLPLARAGFNVTGVDSSVAMLEKTRELAGATPITLVEGDLASLPFRDGLFDTLVSLNTMTHFPHWPEVLAEWARVIRPRGRAIFDVYSTDHDDAYARVVGESAEWAEKHFAPADVASFVLHVRVEDLVESLAPLGFSVKAIVPYSAFFGSAGYNRFFTGTPLSGFGWDRLLSWVNADQALFDFLVFLEEELVSKLTTQTSCRFFAVIDKVDDPAANAAWIAKNRAYNDALRGGLNSEVLQKFADIDPAAFCDALSVQLAHSPSLAAMARILCANLKWDWPISLEGLVADPYRSELADILARAGLDRAVITMLRTMHQQPAVAGDLTYKGVAIGETLEYDGMMEVLDEAFGCFPQSEKMEVAQ